MSFTTNTKNLSLLVDSNNPLNYRNNLNNNSNKPLIIGISGASGFLGLHLISQLIKDSDVIKIKCFIRNRNKFNQKKMEFNLNFSEEKIEFHEDINYNNFKNITNFIHSAAQMHSLKNTPQLWNDNVELTKKFLNITDSKFHYISSLSIFASSNRKSTIDYCKPLENHLIYGGYAQTKWISEYLTSQHPSHQILRLGLLTPSHTNPSFQKHEFFYLFIKLMKNLEIHPRNYEEAFVDISPVDEVAKIISKEIKSNTKIIHIANQKSTSLSEILEKLNTTPVDIKTWNERIKNLRKTEQVLLKYAFFKSEALKQYFHYYNVDLFQSTGHTWNGNITSDIMCKYLENINV